MEIIHPRHCYITNMCCVSRGEASGYAGPLLVTADRLALSLGPDIAGSGHPRAQAVDRKRLPLGEVRVGTNVLIIRMCAVYSSSSID